MRERLIPALPLVCLAAFAFCWIVARACIQSVVIDEADSYVMYTAAPWPDAQLYPASGNHVLNSLGMWLVTHLFGLNELTLRTPAITGALVYIGSAFYVCVLLTQRNLLRVLLFVCLVYNPFVLDYLVAARGYSLAVGFLLAAIAIVAHVIVTRHPDRPISLGVCAVASVFVALSFTANFSFGIVDALALLFFFLWAASQRRNTCSTLAAATFLPGLAVVLLICGKTLWNWPKGQLYFGATSLAEMWNGLVAASFDELHPAIARWVHGLTTVRFKQGLACLTVLLTLALLARVAVDSSGRRDPKATTLWELTRFLAALLVATFLVHWLAFQTVHLLLPMNRTALFFAPLLTLVLGGGLAIRLQAGGRDLLRSCGIAVLLVLALYFFGCLRLGYFKEWRYNADAKHLYWILHDLNRRCEITDFVTEWRYVGALNFYRIYYGNQSMKEFVSAGSGRSYRTNGGAYVLYYYDAEDFIRQQHLAVLYHNDETGAAVAIRGCGSR